MKFVGNFKGWAVVVGYAIVDYGLTWTEAVKAASLLNGKVVSWEVT